MELKIIIVICIYDRFENLRKWAHAWQQCEQMGAKLYIVNNQSPGIDVDFWRKYCENREINYIERENVGFETGIIQDVVTGKLLQDEWDVLFFMTDDTLPISKNFVPLYIEELLKPDIGVVCMEISGMYTPHVRTTGWCIKKEEADKLTFIETPISKKEECYHFEHTGGEDTLMAQILNMKKRVVQQSDIENSAIWDTHHTKLNRWEQWHKEFPQYN